MEDTNNITITPPPYLSASLVGNFERCPWQTIRSQRRQFEEQVAPPDAVSDNSAMQYGTDFHGVMEVIHEFQDNPEELLAHLGGLFGEEAGDVLDSIQEIAERDAVLGRESFGKEIKFELWEPEIGVTITGHIDEILLSPHLDAEGEFDGHTLTIRDFKTGRLYESAVAWTNRIQPRIYNYAVRHPDFVAQNNLPKIAEYRFEICYPRQNATASWGLDPETPALLEYLGKVWRSMCSMYQRGFAEGDPTKYYPQILNEYCRNCQVRQECNKYQNLAQLAMLPDSEESETVVQAFLRLQNFAKIVEGELDARKAQIRSMFSENASRLDLEGHTFLLQSRTETSYSPSEVLNGLLSTTSVDMNDIDLNKLLEVSNVEARRLAKLYPQLAPIFDAAKSTRDGSTWLRHAASRDRHTP